MDSARRVEIMDGRGVIIEGPGAVRVAIADAAVGDKFRNHLLMAGGVPLVLGEQLVVGIGQGDGYFLHRSGRRAAGGGQEKQRNRRRRE